MILTPPSQIFVPVRALGKEVVDNGGDTIAVCFTEAMAGRIATLLNLDATGYLVSNKIVGDVTFSIGTVENPSNKPA